ncbi:MAG: DUF2063 domain-containing protein [Glaciimonas sp.]|nr:DUF2063 domain-containing protein [Glaciimonas sp.]
MIQQQAFFEALLSADQPPPAGLTTWNGSDPTSRFAVYRNNVMASLIEALADTYPVTQELVGELFFCAMARLYIIKEPPGSRVLAYYGASFPNFMEHFPPAASVPYLADVARLEMLRVCAYHAADCAELSAEAIAQILVDADVLPELLVGFHPSVRLLRSQFAVVSLWAAHQGIAEISTIAPDVPENALIIRDHLDVEVMRLNAGDGDFIADLLQGTSLGSAAEQAGLAYPGFDLSSVLSLLIRAHAISSMKMPMKKSMRTNP